MKNQTKHKLYRCWASMRLRCNCPTHPNYHRYGGRGISVCERWNSFDLFVEDMGPKPSPTHSIERVDNDGGYCPSNCVWATSQEQNKNKSQISFLGYLRKNMKPLQYICRVARKAKPWRLHLQLKSRNEEGPYVRYFATLEQALDARADLLMERYMYHTLLNE